jgi:flagellar motor switch protein FliN
MTKSDPARILDEEQLDKAIEELRDVLHEGRAPQGAGNHGHGHANGLIMGIPVDVQVVLGSTEMPVSELMSLQKGSTIALDRRIGDPVDLMVNGRKVASGEITVLEHDPSRFGIRLTHIVDAAKSA